MIVLNASALRWLVCRRHELTLYDALYLDLALREEADLGVHEWIEASFRHVLSSGL